MFFWKKDKTKKVEAPPENILKIPEEFYGAKDPVVHYNSAVKSTAVVQKTAVGGLVEGGSAAAALMGKLGFLRNKKLVYVLIVLGFLLIVGLISWYYIWQARKQVVAPIVTAPTEQPKEEQPAPVEEAVEEPAAEEPIEGVTSTEEAVIEPVAPAPQVLQFPTILLMNSADIDSDSLTDLEEEVFGIDSGTWDTDGDGYYDGQEVFNLYNPAGIAPMKIIDSGLVKEYVNPAWQYRVYYPAQWQVGEVDDEKRAVLFSAITGDYVEVFVSAKDADETFEDWFAREAAGQSYADLQPFTNRFQESGWKRNDDLVAYFATDDAVFALLYNPGVIGSIPFRHVVQMMWQSFRPSKTSIVIPEQTVLPSAPTGSEELPI